MNKIMKIKELNTSYLFKDVVIKGELIHEGLTKPILLKGAFQCQRCEHINMISQKGMKIKRPLECDNEVCGIKGPFLLIPELSEWDDVKIITLSDTDSRRELKVNVMGKDLIEKLPPLNTNVTASGILNIEQKEESTVLDYVLDAKKVSI